MWLRNFDNVMLMASGLPYTTYGTLQNDVYIGNNNTFEDGNVNVKVPSGTVREFRLCYSNSYRAPLICSPYNIVLANGTTAVTYGDYRMSGDVVATSNRLSVANPSIAYDSTSKKFKKVITVTFTNTSSDSVTISEYGLCNQVADLSTTYSYENSSYRHALLYREVLSSPVVVAAGETVTLSLKIDFPMPNHP